ncbi:MAG: sulfatase [Cytophagales bacterium]|nr:sulfatase [Cytophagales bacterium]
MKPVGPEQIQDTHEHDYIALCVSNFKKYIQMKNTFNPICLRMNKALIVLFSVLSLLACNQRRSEQPKPNIILINIDDLGWCDVGFMGSKFYETPVLDKLASSGMIFTNAYAAASNCAPSRACLMSGQWTPRHGIYTVGTSKRGRSKDRKLIPEKNNTILPDSQYILTEVLKDAGYTTCHAGKWHLNDDPRTQGFDVNIGGCHAGNPGSYYPPYKSVPLEAPSEDYYLTDLIMDKTLDFLKSTGENPYFLYYSPYAVHTPIHPVKSLLPKYEDKPAWKGQNNPKYATMVENLDTQIGRMIGYLEKSGKLENTFILFISDNGGVYRVTKQRPLRAGKGSYYEGGIREPMFAYWKGKIEAGTESAEPVSNLDFYPTILEVAGIEKPDNKVLDGQSIIPLLTQQGTLGLRPLYWHFPIYLEGGNAESQDPVFRTRPGSAIRLGDWKLIQYFEGNDIELYNLKNDLSEENNLTDSNPEKVEQLLKMLIAWRKETNAPVPVQLNPEYIP